MKRYKKGMGGLLGLAVIGAIGWALVSRKRLPSWLAVAFQAGEGNAEGNVAPVPISIPTGRKLYIKTMIKNSGPAPVAVNFRFFRNKTIMVDFNRNLAPGESANIGGDSMGFDYGAQRGDTINAGITILDDTGNLGPLTESFTIARVV